MGPHTSVHLDFRKTKVCQLDVTLIGYKHVVWLQIPEKLQLHIQSHLRNELLHIQCIKTGNNSEYLWIIP